MCSSSCPIGSRFRCEQGRICGLHQLNGGESIDTDEPLTTPDDAAEEAIVLWACVLACIAALAAVIFN